MKWTAPALLLAAAATVSPAAEPFELKKGDHVCIIGNTLADRMQHFGWLETLIHSRFPQHELVFRNFGFSGDELTFRQRSMDFGTPDQWLSADAPVPQPNKLNANAPVRKNRFELVGTKADVIFAFFGYNESWAGEAGLPKFRKDLDTFIKHTLAQKYNGHSAPRLVLFSPTAFEDHKSPNLPDGKAINQRLALYTAAMSAAAKANGVRFVDLFTPSRALFANANGIRTINGVHLNEAGDRDVAQLIAADLFGPAAIRASTLQRLRAAVNEKNALFFQHYRATDGYSTFGDRAFLRFVGGQTNYEVAQRELEVIDVMTANRDKVVWAAAQGRDLKPDDSNLPPFIPVTTNKPGVLAGGKHLLLSGEEEIGKLTLGKNLKINLFADEKRFPELAKPVQMAWDTKGRLWVAAWPSYPHWKPGEPMNDKLLILEDTDGDGRADKCTTFADGLHNPTGFEFWNGGVLVAQAPDLLFLKASDGGDKADIRQRVLHGLDSADTHHTANSFALDPGGAVYFQEGTFHHSQIESPYGPSLRLANAGVFRFEPRTQKIDAYVSFGFANPHGHVFDRWGRDIVVDGTGANPFDAVLFSGRIDFPQKHNRPPQVYQQRTRPCAAIEVLSSRHFPDEFQGNLLVTNVIFPTQGILRYRIDENGSSLSGAEQEVVVQSTDPNFRPSDVKVGPDGAIYFIDWHNPIIGHMQHNLRDPSRDREHGRVYRITYAGRELVKPAKVAGESIETLLDLLKAPEDRVRYRARIELSGRKSEAVVAAVAKWLAALDRNDPNFEHLQLEALWAHQAHNVVNLDLLKTVLASKDGRARAAATRVLCYWRDRVSDSLGMLKRLAADPYPRVRLEAIRAASFYREPEAIEVVLIAAEQPTDQYLDFLRNETLRVLEPQLKSAIAAGQKVNFTTEAGARYMLRNVSVEALLKMERTKAVSLELLFRPGIRDEVRREALRGLAKIDGKPELRVLLDALAGLDEKKDGRDESVVFDLVRQLSGRPAAELAAVRGDLEKLATAAQQPFMRQVGYVMLITADANPDQAWALASKSPAAMRDLLAAMPLIGDPGLRASLYPKVEPLLATGPGTAPAAKGVKGRYVRVELPGRMRTLTLAEVEVYSDGQNVARKGKATQKNTSHGGDAGRAIDGNKDGNYGSGGQTHTHEGTPDPWWEVDLGAEYPIESIVIYNRTDGVLGSRLRDYTLKVLDTRRSVVFEKTKQPTPAVKATFVIAAESPEHAVRAAAMTALTSVRGQEAKTFQAVAKFIASDAERTAAIRAIQRIPRSYWPKEEAAALLQPVLAAIRKTPAAERTTPAALEALEFADALSSLLPPADGQKVRAELGELGVRVIRLHTLPERMSYDKDILVVKAGKPVEFLFENTDLMPHNFVITLPGAMEEVGKLAEATATQPDAQARHFVPPSNKVLLKSRLLQPREAERLSWTAPTQPGVYPFVCTYPGHWLRMHGALYVVADLDAYLANPEGYLAANPLPIRDDLLKDRRPRTEWKLEELAPAVAGLKAGRSWAAGRHTFQVAACIACHKLDNVGNDYGADLTKLDPKLTPLDILKDVLEPSAKINEKYQSYVIELKNGVTLTGLIIEEKNGVLKLIENPLAKAEPRTIRVDQIAERTKSTTSLMPKGLLDKLTKDEILDLIAFLAARGDKNHPLFHGEGHEHHH